MVIGLTKTLIFYQKGPLFIFVFSVFLFLNLTFAISSQIMISSLAFASSNNNADQPNPSRSSSDSKQPFHAPNNLNNPSTIDNNPDTNVGFLDSGTIDKDTLKGKNVRSESIETARIDALIWSYDKTKYFDEETMKDLAKTVSVCIETLTPVGNTILAVPHCATGLNVTQKFAVEPGQINLDIRHSPQLSVDSEPRHCSIYHLDPKEKKRCLIIFKPTVIQGDITPKPSSDFGKTMITP